MAQANLGVTGANALLNKKLKLFAAGILDSIPYIRMSRSYFKDDVKGKKAGKEYLFYVPDPGMAKAGTDNLNIGNTNGGLNLNGQVWERPVTCKLVDGVARVDLTAWHKLTAIEDFKQTIVDPRARNLGTEIEKSVIEENVFRVDSAIVDSTGTPSIRQFTRLVSKLRGIRSNGAKVAFAHPDVFACLTEGFLGKYLPSDIMKKIYGQLDVGNFAGAEWIEENYMPFVTATGSETIIGVNFTTGVVTGTGLFNGLPFTVTGGDGKKLKTVDLTGKPTNEDFVFIVTEVNDAGTSGKIQLEAGEIRFMNGTVSDQVSTIVDYSNPTIGYKRYASDGTDYLGTLGSSSGNFSVTKLLSAGTYAVIQIRDRDALEFDSYEFDEVAGAKNEKLKACEINVQSVEQGNVETRDSIMRIDVPYMAKLVLTKLARVLYMKVVD